MNKVAFSLAVLLPISSLSLFASDNFTGQWSGQEKNDNGSLYSTLTLKLKQNNNNITGSYCYVTRGGNKIDCPDDNDSNLKGTANGKNALIEFDSSFGGVKGKANLELEGKTTQPVNSNKAEGMLFNNSGVDYVVSFNPLELKVVQGNKTLVKQDGKWE
ncbi:hypothetical protein [Pantoea agglomerans]|uniref:hypothetical protein n=1 Tax=Enterobacter agglomerans TaxID=549 RepID=UPI001FDABF4D|nr:hypothetical protein [Pantoea agglomerans]